jgi:hypothetical protein
MADRLKKNTAGGGIYISNHNRHGSMDEKNENAII